MSRSWRQYRYRLSCAPLVQPRKMSLAACIIRCPCTTRSPGCRNLLFGRWSSSTDRVASLTWRNKRILLVAALEQGDERPRTDAADAHDLAGDVDDFELFQQVTPVVLQRGPVGPELLTNHVLNLIGGHADTSRPAPGRG